jgi:hypothetical protein
MFLNNLRWLTEAGSPTRKITTRGTTGWFTAPVATMLLSEGSA